MSYELACVSAQSAGSINGGGLHLSPYYAAAAGAAPASATAAATPDGMVFATNALYQSPEAVAEAVPMMEPAQAEVGFSDRRGVRDGRVRDGRVRGGRSVGGNQ